MAQLRSLHVFLHASRTCLLWAPHAVMPEKMIQVAAKSNKRVHWLALVAACAILTFPPAAGTLQCINAAPCRLGCSAQCLDGSSLYALSSLAIRARRQAASAATEQPQPVILKPRNSLMSMDSLISRVVEVAEQKISVSIQNLAANQYPTATLPESGQWMFNRAGHWTSGFFAGVLWQLHALTGKQEWADAAQKWQEGLRNKQRTWQSQHDYGARQLAHTKPTFT